LASHVQNFYTSRGARHLQVKQTEEVDLSRCRQCREMVKGRP
jgi:hypothetical protein